MTYQKAAYRILKEKGKPLKLTNIAEIAFQKGIANSKAENPIRSFAETIKKNIRGNTYNSPKLVDIAAPRGRFVVLPEWL